MPTQYRYLVTNGNLGTFDQSIVRYSVHPNGRRALMNTIQEHADRTGLESWAYPWPEHSDPDKRNRYYPRKPRS